MFWLLLLVAVLLVIIVIIEELNKHEKFDKIPGPKGIYFLHNALDFMMTPVEIFRYFVLTTFKNNGFFKLKIGPKRFIILTKPEDVEILISGLNNNSKGFVYSFLEPWFKEGLLLSDGIKWHQRRKILTPAFHFNILQHFKILLEENSWKLAETLKQEVDKSKTDIGSYIVQFTLQSICETAMGIKLDTNTEGTKYKSSIMNIGDIIVHRIERFWLYPKTIFSLTSSGRKQKQLLEYLVAFRDSVIRTRRSSLEYNSLLLDITKNAENKDGEKRRLAMLDLLLEAERNGMIDGSGIGEEVDTFMFEGHDTTASALQFCFMLIANHPDVQDKIIKEYNAVMENTSRTITMNDLAQMKYLECCIKESMRLYPPVYQISRRLNKDTKFSDYEVPAGVDCTILIYCLHRGSHFKDPLKFHPERFIDEAHTWHPYSYIPFSAGPRNCIGQKFAMMEMKLAVSSVLSQYQILPVTKPEDIVITADIILRPETPIYIKIEKRQ